MNTRPNHSRPLRASVRKGMGVVVLLSTAALTGCAALAPENAGAQRVTETFLTAIADADGETACMQLNDSAREAVEEQTKTDCAEGVLELGIDTGGVVSPAEVYSRASFVETGETAVFLTPGDEGWLIRAAGCTPVAEGPFDCVLDGS